MMCLSRCVALAHWCCCSYRKGCWPFWGLSFCPFPPAQYKHSNQGSNKRTSHVVGHYLHQYPFRRRDRVGDTHPSQLGSSSHCHLHIISLVHPSTPPSPFYQLLEGRLGALPPWNGGRICFSTSICFLRQWGTHHYSSRQARHSGCLFQGLHPSLHYMHSLMRPPSLSPGRRKRCVE